MNQRTNDYKYRGARAAVALQEKHLYGFLNTWRQAMEAGVKLPICDNPDYASFETLLGHVFRWSRNYLLWICKQLNISPPDIDSPPEADVIDSKGERYLEHLTAAWKTPLKEIPEEKFFKPEYPSPWGVLYCIDAMLEHAVMHPILHSFQLKELMDP